MAFLNETGLQKLWQQIDNKFARITEVDEIVSKKPGRLVEGEELTYTKSNVEFNTDIEITAIAETGAEIFNDLTTNVAIGLYSHAEGCNTFAANSHTHTEGKNTIANGDSSHAEGMDTIASGVFSHAEGQAVMAYGRSSHAEGLGIPTTVTLTGAANTHEYTAKSSSPLKVGEVLHNRLENRSARIASIVLIAEAQEEYEYTIFVDKTLNTLSDLNSQEVIIYHIGVALGECSHVEGSWSAAYGDSSHAEGMSTEAYGDSSHAEGEDTTAYGNSSHAEGENSKAVGTGAHAEGNNVMAYGSYSHAEGLGTNNTIHLTGVANSYDYSIADSPDIEINGSILYYAEENRFAKIVDVFSSGISVDASLNPNSDFNSQEVIIYNAGVASGECSHVEGQGAIATGYASHAEGGSYAYGAFSHAEGGSNTLASGTGSHAEGLGSEAEGRSSHAEGLQTAALGEGSHAEGLGTLADGEGSHAEGIYTIASGTYQHTQGKCNIEDTDERYAHIVGNGDDTARSNAHTLDWEGNTWYAGNLYLGGTSMDDATIRGIIVHNSTTSLPTVTNGAILIAYDE